MSAGVDGNMRRSHRLYEEIFGNGHYGVADELMAPDIVNHGPGSPPAGGTEGIKRQAALLRAAIPDLRVPHLGLVEGRRPAREQVQRVPGPQGGHY